MDVQSDVGDLFSFNAGYEKRECGRQIANDASSHARRALLGIRPREFVAEKVHELQFFKWVGMANAIGWRVGSFLNITANMNHD